MTETVCDGTVSSLAARAGISFDLLEASNRYRSCSCSPGHKESPNYAETNLVKKFTGKFIIHEHAVDSLGTS